MGTSSANLLNFLMNSVTVEDIERIEAINKKVECIISTGLSFKFSRKVVAKLEQEALDNPKEEFKEVCLLD